MDLGAALFNHNTNLLTQVTLLLSLSFPLVDCGETLIMHLLEVFKKYYYHPITLINYLVVCDIHCVLIIDLEMCLVLVVLDFSCPLKGDGYNGRRLLLKHSYISLVLIRLSVVEVASKANSSTVDISVTMKTHTDKSKSEMMLCLSLFLHRSKRG